MDAVGYDACDDGEVPELFSLEPVVSVDQAVGSCILQAATRY